MSEETKAIIEPTVTIGTLITADVIPSPVIDAVKVMTESSITAEITPSSIIEGQVLLSESNDASPYEGNYEIKPLARNEVVLNTQGKLMNKNITVLQVPYFETSNQTGYTVYIAEEV